MGAARIATTLPNSSLVSGWSRTHWMNLLAHALEVNSISECFLGEKWRMRMFSTFIGGSKICGNRNARKDLRSLVILGMEVVKWTEPSEITVRCGSGRRVRGGTGS